MEEQTQENEWIKKAQIKNEDITLQKKDRELGIVEITCSKYSAKLNLIARGEGLGRDNEMRNNLIVGTNLATNEDCREKKVN